jgi:[ribosomal protein S5]-alanine N-acetyltransferase
MRYLLTGEETKRLHFRLLRDDDFDTWLPFFSTPESEKFLGLAGIPTPIERCRKWFELVNNRYKNDLGGMNALIEKHTDAFIGQCGLLVQEVDDNKELEIGYSILPEFWGKGFATEAAQKCKEFAFTNSVTSTLISIIHIENYRSEKVALKNGMQLEKQTVFKDMPVNVFRVHKS